MFILCLHDLCRELKIEQDKTETNPTFLEVMI